MKKRFWILLAVIAALCLLTACNFSTNLSNAGSSQMQATPKAKEMMSALAANDSAAAVKMMHPDVMEKADEAIAQMSGYVAGRKTTQLQLVNFNVSTSAGTSGKIRQEKVVYQATLEDGEMIYLSATYVSGNAGEGFASFQIVLGAV